jgi:hypothetical protein
MMSERVMTYDELAIALRRTPEAVRQLVKRRRWRRSVGNDGKARIAVPIENLESDRIDDQGDDPAMTGDKSQVSALVSPGHTGGDRPDVAGILAGHISLLQQELETVRQERDTAKSERDTAKAAEQALALQLGALQAVLDAERTLLTVERERTAAESGTRVGRVEGRRDRFASSGGECSPRRRGPASWLSRGGGRG